MEFSTYSTQNHQFKIPPIAFLSKPPNIMFTNNSVYTVYTIMIIPNMGVPRGPSIGVYVIDKTSQWSSSSMTTWSVYIEAI